MKLSSIIKSRRTIKPLHFNEQKVTNNDVQELIESADWAPTHKMTEPWRFIVFTNEAKKQFGQDHAKLYKKVTFPEKFQKEKYDKIMTIADKSSHIVAIIMKRDELERVPEIEEVCAVACAVQNMMLVATEKNIAHIWSTGGMCFYPEMKTYLGFGEKDKVLGFLYLGKSDLKPKSKRFIPLEEKVVWNV